MFYPVPSLMRDVRLKTSFHFSVSTKGKNGEEISHMMSVEYISFPKHMTVFKEESNSQI